MNFADVAHIIGTNPSGPRGHDELSKSLSTDVSNLMLLCLEHHRMIDTICEQFSDEELRQMKREHESRIEQLTAIRPDKASHVVLYKGVIDDQVPTIDTADAWRAMTPNWYPASPLPVELGLSNSAYRDRESEYWRFECSNLQRQFENKITPLIESHNHQHFSVFAFAPQPLLIVLGLLFSDVQRAEVYQLHREPQTWEWLPGPNDFEFLIKPAETAEAEVALILSLSASIDKARVISSVEDKSMSIWEMSIDNRHNDFLKSHGQLRLFRQSLRKLLDQIKLRHGQNALLRIFPAVPVAVAVEVGRVWQAKSDLPMVIYDQNTANGGFQQAIDTRDLMR